MLWKSCAWVPNFFTPKYLTVTCHSMSKQDLIWITKRMRHQFKNRSYQSNMKSAKRKWEQASNLRSNLGEKMVKSLRLYEKFMGAIPQRKQFTVLRRDSIISTMMPVAADQLHQLESGPALSKEKIWLTAETITNTRDISIGSAYKILTDNSNLDTYCSKGNPSCCAQISYKYKQSFQWKFYTSESKILKHPFEEL